jgi:hypothetical protein
MPLTAAQLTALAADIAINTATAPGTAGQIKNLLKNGDNAYAVAAWYNQFTAAYKVWGTQVDLKAIRSFVNMAQFTPADAVPASGGTTTITNDQLAYQNRALVCQLKQANAIVLTSGEGQIDCSSLQLRQNFNDCMTLIPSGVAGANQNAGWGTSAAPGAVRLAMQRNATNAEKLFAVASTAAPNAGNVGTDARGATTNPDTLIVVGTISDADVRAAWVI